MQCWIIFSLPFFSGLSEPAIFGKSLSCIPICEEWKRLNIFKWSLSSLPNTSSQPKQLFRINFFIFLIMETSLPLFFHDIQFDGGDGNGTENYCSVNSNALFILGMGGKNNAKLFFQYQQSNVCTIHIFGSDVWHFAFTNQLSQILRQLLVCITT